jgi:hypothetical protein
MNHNINLHAKNFVATEFLHRYVTYISYKFTNGTGET